MDITIFCYIILKYSSRMIVRHYSRTIHIHVARQCCNYDRRVNGHVEIATLSRPYQWLSTLIRFVNE